MKTKVYECLRGAIGLSGVRFYRVINGRRRYLKLCKDYIMSDADTLTFLKPVKADAIGFVCSKRKFQWQSVSK